MFNQDFLKKLNILFVEDDNIAREKLAKVLSRFFKNVLTATNGEEGLETFKEAKDPIDIILSDINMPKMDGIEMLKNIREFDKDIPLIYTTARQESEYLQKAIELNVNYYAIKPVDIESVIRKIEEACQKRYYEETLKQKNDELEIQLNAIDNVAAIIKIDNKKNISYINSMVEDIFEYSKDEMIDKPFESFLHKDVDKSQIEKLWDSVIKGKTWHSNLKFSNKKQNVFYLNSTIFLVINDDGYEYRFIGFLSTKEVNDQREFKKQVMNLYLNYRKKEDDYSSKINELEGKLKHSEDGDFYLNKQLAEYKEKNKRLLSQINHYEKEERIRNSIKHKENLVELYQEALTDNELQKKQIHVLKEAIESKNIEIKEQKQKIQEQKDLIKDLKEFID